MTQLDQTPDTDLRAPSQTGRGLRWTVRLLFLACGLMMGVVLLSQPRVLSHVQAGADRIVDLIAPDQTSRHAAAVAPSPQAREAEQMLQATPVDTAPVSAAHQPIAASASERNRPTASVMPGNRVPIRRGGVLNGG